MFTNKKLQESVNNIESTVNRIDQRMSKHIDKINSNIQEISTNASELFTQLDKSMHLNDTWSMHNATKSLTSIVALAYCGKTQTIIHNGCIVEVIRKRNLKNNNDNNIEEKS